MSHGALARFSSVEVVADGSSALLCIVGIRHVWVPVDEIRYGTKVAKLGDRGVLVVTRQFARNAGLTVRPRQVGASDVHRASPLR
jgi:hypothetical protein